MNIEKDIEKVIKNNGNNLNFKLIYEFEIKVRDGKSVSILLNKQERDVKIVYKLDIPNLKQEGKFGYE